MHSTVSREPKKYILRLPGAQYIACSRLNPLGNTKNGVEIIPSQRLVAKHAVLHVVSGISHSIPLRKRTALQCNTIPEFLEYFNEVFICYVNMEGEKRLNLGCYDSSGEEEETKEDETVHEKENGEKQQCEKTATTFPDESIKLVNPVDYEKDAEDSRHYASGPEIGREDGSSGNLTSEVVYVESDVRCS